MVMLDDRWIKYEGDIRGYDGKGVKQEEGEGVVMQQNKFATMARDNRQSQSVVDGVGWTERGSRQERESNEK